MAEVKVDTPAPAAAATTIEVTAATAAAAAATTTVATAAAAAGKEINLRRKHQTYVTTMNSMGKMPDLAERAV